MSVGRNAVWLAFEDEDRLRVASLRKSIERLALVPGDLVLARQVDDEHVLVERREPRVFALERHTAGGRRKTMAANVDGIAIVSALADPPPHLGMIDELLAFAEIERIGARLVLTKPDLAGPEQSAATAALYRQLGYVVLVVNPKAAQGIEAFAEELAGRRTLLIGQSGVGKSSLFRALGGSAEVGEVSKSGRGRQTTSAGRLHRFSDGFLIDSPGVGEFELHEVGSSLIATGFREFAEFVGSCRFSDCTHRDEPGCTLRAAVERGPIAASRYASYRGILAREGDGTPSVQRI
ncbi:MAG: ribosome small subunit-dependent GTPase A [Vulcanimicrobiaceae bacterium]